MEDALRYIGITAYYSNLLEVHQLKTVSFSHIVNIHSPLQEPI